MKKLKTWAIGAVALVVLYFGYTFVDKYFNAGPANANAADYVLDFYGKPLEKASCSSIDSTGSGRVGCTVSIKDKNEQVKVLSLSCKGRFDMLESGAPCIPTIANAQ